MDTSPYLNVSLDNDVATITLNRPRHNILNIEMMNGIVDTIDYFSRDDTLKAMVIKGEGPSFCAGVEVGDHKPALVKEMVTVFNKMFKTIHQLNTPLIAAVSGNALGGGMELAIAADILIADETAIFGQPEIKLGFFPPYAAIRLPELIGVAKTIEVLTTGKRYTAVESKAMGFVSKVVPEKDLETELHQIKSEIRYSSPLIIRMNKQAVNVLKGERFSDALEKSEDLFLNRLMKTEDTLEGLKSFDEKRKPQWLNR